MSTENEKKDVVILIGVCFICGVASWVASERSFFAFAGIFFSALAFIKLDVLTILQKRLLIAAAVLCVSSAVQFYVVKRMTSRPQKVTPEMIKKNDSAVIGVLFAAFDGARKFYDENGYFPQDMYELVYAEPEPYVDEEIVKRKATKYSYHFRVSADPRQFVVVAIPNKGLSSGEATLCIVEDGMVHYDAVGNDITSVSLCKMLPRLQ
ncbi:MAG: hypothetical protein KC684_06165 [Candidatus Omnitrophica bacterium]|nr:hypothetical protein [Candidatus Omnitrophota bacterium]